MHIWRQNISEGRLGLHRRGAIWFKEDGASVHGEVHFPSRHCGVRVQVGFDDEPLNLFFGVGLALWLSIDARWCQRLRDRLVRRRADGKPTYEGREWEITFHSGAAYWNIGCSSDGWSKSDGWRHSSFNPADFFFGHHKHTERTIQDAEPVRLNLDGRSYEGTVRIFESSWKRTRWPFVRRIVRADVQFPNPPKFAGKGENSWDQGDDGMFALTCPATTVDEALGHYLTLLKQRRECYGMPEGVVA